MEDKIEKTFLETFTTKMSQYVSKFEVDLEELRDMSISFSAANTLMIVDLQQENEEKHDAFQERLKTYLQFSAEQQAHSLRGLELYINHNLKKDSEKERREMRTLFAQCVSWISMNLDFRQELRDRCNEHLEGTGEWFLSSKKYIDWKSNHQSDLLFVQGNPGSGKSILSAIAISDLSSDMDPNVGIAYVFCHRAERMRQTIITVIGSIIGQLLRQRNELNPYVKDAYLKSLTGQSVESEEAFNLLNYTTDMFDRVYLVMDAVDEFHDAGDLLRSLLAALKETRFRRILKILVLSRQVAEVDNELDAQRYFPIRLQEENHEDIKMYIQTYLPGEDMAKARRCCLIKAHGMFQWVKLVFANPMIRNALPNDVLDTINDLPDELNGIYDRVFQELSSRRLRSKAWLVLHWILSAYKPLNVDEMLEAVEDYRNVTSVKKIAKYKSGNFLVELCIHITRKGYFSFIHDSVEQYLKQDKPTSEILRKFQLEHEDAHDILARTCLKYLSLGDFDGDIPGPQHDLAKIAAECPFIVYAAVF